MKIFKEENLENGLEDIYPDKLMGGTKFRYERALKALENHVGFILDPCSNDTSNRYGLNDTGVPTEVILDEFEEMFEEFCEGAIIYSQLEKFFKRADDIIQYYVNEEKEDREYWGENDQSYKRNDSDLIFVESKKLIEGRSGYTRDNFVDQDNSFWVIDHEGIDGDFSTIVFNERGSDFFDDREPADMYIAEYSGGYTEAFDTLEAAQDYILERLDSDIEDATISEDAWIENATGDRLDNWMDVVLAEDPQAVIEVFDSMNEPCYAQDVLNANIINIEYDNYDNVYKVTVDTVY